MSSSPEAYGNEGNEFKKRGIKRRKKRTIVQPQRPVSAYALFFRDTQDAIKAENSSATFGEISKIVASMWDSLSEEDKQVYKKKTETAKRVYLEQLAEYRASMGIKGTNMDVEEEDSQPLSVLREKIVEQQRATTSGPVGQQVGTNAEVIDLTGLSDNLPLPPKLQLAPGAQMPDTQPLQATQKVLNFTAMQQRPPRPISPGATLTKIILPGQNGAQSTIHVINTVSTMESPTSRPNPTVSPLAKHIILRPGPTGQSAMSVTPPTPPPIHLRNIATQQKDSPITIVPSKPGQIIKLVPSETGGMTFASVDADVVKGRILKIGDIVRPTRTPSPGTSRTEQKHMAKMSGQTPILQLVAQESLMDGDEEMEFAGLEAHQGREDDVDGKVRVQKSRQDAFSNSASVDDFAPSPHENQVNMVARQCVKQGCTNDAISSPFWNNEYCSNECVHSHCRDIFDAWISAR